MQIKMIKVKEIAKVHLSLFLGLLNNDRKLTTQALIRPIVKKNKPVGINQNDSFNVSSARTSELMILNETKEIIPNIKNIRLNIYCFFI